MDWNRFTDILAEFSGNGEIGTESLLFEELDLDSFQMMQVICELEDEGAELDFEQLNRVKTVGELFRAVRGG